MNMIDLSRRAETNFKPIAPEGLTYLPFQRSGIEYALATECGCLIADEMGLGKTIQALGYVNEMHSAKRVIVVVPASLKLNWLAEAQKWLVGDWKFHVFYDSKKGCKTYGSGSKEMLIIAYSMASRIKCPQCDILICDEAHYVKTVGTKRTESIAAIKRNKLILLSGTPIMNRNAELWSLLRLLDPVRIKARDRKQFEEIYCGGRFVNFKRRGRIITEWMATASFRTAELNDILRSRYMVRRLKKNVAKDLPAKRIQLIEVASYGVCEPKNIIRNIQDIWSKFKQEEDVDDAYKKSAQELDCELRVKFEKYAKLRHDTALRGLAPKIEFAKMKLKEEDKIIIFSHHRDVMEIVAKTFKDSVTYWGGMSDEAKNKAKVAFQNDPSVRVFNGQIEAAGVGLTLTASSCVIFFELDESPGHIMQAIDRTHRIGQKSMVNAYLLVLRDSLDAMMAKRIVHKQEIVECLNL